MPTARLMVRFLYSPPYSGNNSQGDDGVCKTLTARCASFDSKIAHQNKCFSSNDGSCRGLKNPISWFDSKGKHQNLVRSLESESKCVAPERVENVTDLTNYII